MPPETTETPLETLTDRELLLRAVRVLEHLDPMVHAVAQRVEQAAPLLERFVGNPVADYLAHRKGTSRGRRARTAD